MAGTRKSSGLKWVVIALLLGGAGWGGYVYFRHGAEEPVEFKTATLARGDLTQAVTANGQLTPVKNVAVGSQISGIIKEIRADFNARVKEGDIIAQIDPATYEQNVTQARAELLSAQAALELAQVNSRRNEELRQKKLIALSEADASLAELHQAEAVVKMREAALNRAKVDLERTTIYAPISGVVISRAVDVGQTVAASFNTPTLFQIANDLAKMEIDAMVSEADVGGVEEGQKVTFTVDAFPSRQFHGIVRQVRYAPTTNQNVVTYTTVVDVNNADLKLRPGMTANASIITAQRTNAIKIPNAALRFRPPDDAILKPTGNAPDGKSGITNLASRTEGAGRGDGTIPAVTGGSDSDERRRRWESMSPEERAAMRERMRGRFGEGGPPGFGGSGGAGSARNRADGPVTRTIYVPVKTTAANGQERQLAQAMTIKTGISDGVSTEVIEGLKEGDVVITGVNTPAPVTAAGPPGSSPFGGPSRGGFRGR